MSTKLAERLRGGIAALVIGLVGTTVSACTGDGSTPPTRAVPVVPEDVAVRLQGVLDARTAAFANGDRAALVATLDPGDRGLRRQQRTLLGNLKQLPVERLDFTLERSSMVVGDDTVTAVVRRRLQLSEYDEMPVVTPDRLSFVLRDGEWLIDSASDPVWQALNKIDVPPWDKGPIQVRTARGVLGIFDADSVDAAAGVLAEVSDGLVAVDALVPLPWEPHVVVYALSDDGALAAVDDVPGGDPGRLDGLAFPVQAGPRSRHLAATRFVLHPRMLEQPGLARQRLIRHELTHVAIGARDDHVPLWLSEGIAEWVSVQPLPAGERVISQDAVAASTGTVEALPTDADFAGDHPGASYGLAWWACEWIVRHDGPETLWALLDAMAAGDGIAEADQDVVLVDLLGIDSGALARKAARRIAATFG